MSQACMSFQGLVLPRNGLRMPAAGMPPFPCVPLTPASYLLPKPRKGIGGPCSRAGHRAIIAILFSSPAAFCSCPRYSPGNL